MISRLYLYSFVQLCPFRGSCRKQTVIWNDTVCDYNLMCSRFKIHSTNLPRDKCMCDFRSCFHLRLSKLYFIKFTHLHLFSHAHLPPGSHPNMAFFPSFLWRKYHMDSASCWLLPMFLPAWEYMTVSQGSKAKCVRRWTQSLCVVCCTFVRFWYYWHSWFLFYNRQKKENFYRYWYLLIGFNLQPFPLNLITKQRLKFSYHVYKTQRQEDSNLYAENILNL